MFFILSQKRSNQGCIIHHQLGIVVADSIELAAAKVGLPIVVSVAPPEAGCIYAKLEHEYSLEGMGEITRTIAELEESYRRSDDIKIPMPTTQDLFDGGILE